MEMLCEGQDCIDSPYSENQKLVRGCDPRSFEPVWFQIDRHSYKIPANSYLILLSTEADVEGLFYCEIRFARETTDRDYGILGINFLENYQQLYDVEVNQQCLKPIKDDG